MGIRRRSCATLTDKIFIDGNYSKFLQQHTSNDQHQSSSKFTSKKLGNRTARLKHSAARNIKKTEFIFVSPLPETSSKVFMMKILSMCCLACDVLLVSNLIGEANLLMKDKQIDHIWKHFKSRSIKKINIIEPDW
ncbi:uncharacterized protein LOC120351146 [Nilaparvata lugens]|uniref:uncharacterized protein LOC120351146 n=1 Tax=Nilaparvata lugens TaxID=108931 RepID=UPI00193CA5FD|nr:uncharacterized protein LOC120351146 [Nilaparvata lugens]